MIGNLSENLKQYILDSLDDDDLSNFGKTNGVNGRIVTKIYSKRASATLEKKRELDQNISNDRRELRENSNLSEKERDDIDKRIRANEWKSLDYKAKFMDQARKGGGFNRWVGVIFL